jgi:sugar O-acyltransferase (sialic acid O-acetyltransferase NeuD family)
MTKQLVIFGDRTAAEMLAVAEEINAGQFAQIRTFFVSQDRQDLIRFLASLADGENEVFYLIGIIDLEIRRRVEENCQEHRLIPHTLIHPSAYVAPTAQIGRGCFIAPLVAIGIDTKIADHCILHFGTSIGHDCQLGRHCAVLPGARISGQVKLADGVLVGSNAFVHQGVSVGSDAKIDAMTYVRENVPERRIVSMRRPL